MVHLNHEDWVPTKPDTHFCRTLMRPLFVQRHTFPESGSFRFFPPCELRAASRRGRVLPSCPCAGAHHPWRHHTRMAVQSPRAGRWQRTVGVLLGDRAIMWCPPTVLRKRPAARVGLAREGQARGRGSPRNPWASQRHSSRRQRGRPITRQGAGRGVRCTPGRATTQPSRRYSVRDAGASRAGPVRAPAHPRCAWRYGGR
jgi:hypothetical protein